MPTAVRSPSNGPGDRACPPSTEFETPDFRAGPVEGLLPVSRSVSDLGDDAASEGESDSESGSPGAPLLKRTRTGFFSDTSVEEGDAEAEVEKAAGQQHPEIDLGKLDLQQVPASLFISCAHVVSLNLDNNLLEALPDAFGGLRALKRLSAKCNRISTLPASFGQLVSLEYLYLDRNCIQELPESCSRLTKLEVLGLDHNDLTAFPNCLCALPALRQLYLQGNPHVSKLPAADQAMGFRGLQLHVDNAPTLVAQAGSYASTNVHFLWTDIFPDKVLDYLYLGSLRSAQEPHVYAELGITHVATIGRELQVVLGKGMQHMKLDVDDLPGTDLMPHFDKVHAFIERAHAAGGACLVHCARGQSRSVTMVCSYLMHTRGMRRDAALSFVRERHPTACPNHGFMGCMAHYEAALRLGAPPEAASAAGQGGAAPDRKRKRDEDDQPAQAAPALRFGPAPGLAPALPG